MLCPQVFFHCSATVCHSAVANCAQSCPRKSMWIRINSNYTAIFQLDNWLVSEALEDCESAIKFYVNLGSDSPFACLFSRERCICWIQDIHRSGGFQWSSDPDRGLCWSARVNLSCSDTCSNLWTLHVSFLKEIQKSCNLPWWLIVLLCPYFLGIEFMIHISCFKIY